MPCTYLFQRTVYLNSALFRSTVVKQRHPTHPPINQSIHPFNHRYVHPS